MNNRAQASSEKEIPFRLVNLINRQSGANFVECSLPACSSILTWSISHRPLLRRVFRSSPQIRKSGTVYVVGIKRSELQKLPRWNINGIQRNALDLYYAFAYQFVIKHENVYVSAKRVRIASVICESVVSRERISAI